MEITEMKMVDSKERVNKNKISCELRGHNIFENVYLTGPFSNL